MPSPRPETPARSTLSIRQAEGAGGLAPTPEGEAKTDRAAAVLSVWGTFTKRPRGPNPPWEGGEGPREARFGFSSGVRDHSPEHVMKIVAPALAPPSPTKRMMRFSVSGQSATISGLPV